MPSGIASVPGLSSRDQAVIKLIGDFRQLSAAHIRTALFAGTTSKTPLDRCLKRLVEHRYLVRLSRLVGGDGGGSAQYVYQLGRAGWRLLGREGDYWVPRSVNLHTLAIADSHQRLVQAEHDGWLTVITFEPEPNCHVSVGSVRLTPDAYTEIGLHEQRLKIGLWLEVDRGTEKGEVIREKCIRYWRAYQTWEDEVFPYIAFVVPDLARSRVIERVIESGPVEAQELFRVYRLEHLAEDIHRNLR